MDERKKILEMLSAGKISVQEAEQLLAAVGAEQTSSGAASTGRKKYLRVEVNSSKEEGTEKVNIRVPLQLLRAGVKLASLMPNNVQDKVGNMLEEKGIQFDFKNASPGAFDELIQQLEELEVNVDSDKEKVRIYVE